MSHSFFRNPAAAMLRQLVARVYARSLLKPAFIWWREQLLACLPKRWATYLKTFNRTLYATWPLQGTAPTKHDVTLILPTDEVLVCRLNLPWNAAYHLRDVMGFELDKYTPFSTEQVYFDLLPGPLIKGKPIPLTLWVIPRKHLHYILEQAADNGFSVSRIDVADAVKCPVGVNLMPASAASTFASQVTQLKLIAGIAILVMGISLGLSLLSNREARLEAMQQQVQQMRLQAKQVDVMRQKLQARQEIEATLRHSAPGEHAAVELLDKLTQCLDSDTWIEQLNVDAKGEVRLAGFSRQASDLPATLMDCVGLDKPAFFGPVQADRNTGTERFTLVAQRPVSRGRP